jgi:hypothetical protein
LDVRLIARRYSAFELKKSNLYMVTRMKNMGLSGMLGNMNKKVENK